MLLPISWLRQFVSVNESTDAISERFTALGFECEVKSPQLVDLDITPNRGDCLSILGLAREYAAATNQSVKMPDYASLEQDQNNLPITSFSGDSAAFIRVSAAEVSNITVAPSPPWLADAVTSAGMNSINTIVDLTNYVMFELGIPMHAFDLDKLPSRTLDIRLSEPGEIFVSLKGEKIELPDRSVVVESGGQIIDLLGIRGGQSTMITEKTQNIFVWAVNVPRALIRRSVKKTGLSTEGAYRHERETDLEMTPLAVARFIKLLEKVGGGESSCIVTVTPEPPKTKQIEFDTAHVNQLLGTTYSEAQIVAPLTALGMAFNGSGVTIPSWRYHDLNTAEDLIEEVARINGYQALPRQVIAPTKLVLNTQYARNESIKDQLVSEGMCEVYTESFSGRVDGKILGWQEDNLAVLSNPVNRDLAYCRPAIMPHLIKILAQNSWSDDARIFELGNVFPTKELEETHLALAAYGKQQKLFESWVPSNAIEVIMPDHPLAILHKIRRPITVAEVALDQVLLEPQSSFAVTSEKPKIQKVSPYPPAVRDISLIIDTSVDPSELCQAIQETAPEHIVLVELFDQFRSDKFGPNKQSLAYHVVYQSLTKTLDTSEVDGLHAQVISMLKNEYQVEVR